MRSRRSTSWPQRPGGTISVQDVLQLLGAVEEEALFRLCDFVVDRDTAGALTFIEELADQGQDLGRFVIDLLEHLRQLLLVQHMGEVPDSLPLTGETRERLHAQANQLGEPAVVRLCDLLTVAVDDLRQGGDPRLPLELALVKVTRPAADLEHESLAYRIEALEQRPHGAPAPAPPPAAPAQPAAPPAGRDAGAADGARAAATNGPPLELAQLQDAWARSVLPHVEQRSIPTAAIYREAHPVALDGDRRRPSSSPAPRRSTGSSPRRRRTCRCSPTRCTR